MKRTVKTVDKQTFIIEEFNNFNELLATNDSRKMNFSDNPKGSRKADDNRWRGGTYEEAVEMLRFGWSDKDKVRTVKEKVSNLEKMQSVDKMYVKNDIVGFAPIVPLALKGVPQCMINSARKPKKAKVINLVVDISASCGTSTEEFLEWGAKMVAKVMNLEKEGYRVKIEVAMTFIQNDWRTKAHAVKILIKSENQPFDIQRMMFPMAHKAMFRRIGFDWYERLPEAEEIYGYGKSLVHHDGKHRKVCQETIADTANSYYICNKDDIDEVLKSH